MPIQTAGSLQHLSKVRIDIDDCGKSLRAFWDTGEDDCRAQAHVLYGAAEALMRALSTLTQVVEDAQRVEPAPTTQDCLCLHAIEQVAGQPTVHDRRCLVGYPPTPALAGWMFS